MKFVWYISSLLLLYLFRASDSNVLNYNFATGFRGGIVAPRFSAPLSISLIYKVEQSKNYYTRHSRVTPNVANLVSPLASK